jgi:glucan phosphoethanolaminetransferase (alkaline phosphatase superfamily)
MAGMLAGVVSIAVFSYQWRNFPYVVMLLAPLCLAVAMHVSPKYQLWAVVLLAMILGLKLTPSDRVWSLTYPTSQPLAAALCCALTPIAAARTS